MAFDGLVNYTITEELNSHIVNGKIDKILQPNSNEIILSIYCNGIKYALDSVISSNNYRICLTTNSKPNPTFAPNFCMVLRKHLLNTKISKIYTLGLERITIIEFEGHSKDNDSGTKKLIIELMGKYSNIILVNSENVIIDSIKHFTLDSNSYRNVLPNYKYILPISNKLDFTKITNSNDFYITTLSYIKDNLDIQNNVKLTDVLPNVYTGISKTSIMNILYELHLEDIFTQDTMTHIYNYLYNTINSNSNIILKMLDDKQYSISLTNSEKSNHLQANFFIDDLYFKKENNENFITYRNNLSKLILNYMKKLTQKLSNINSKLKDCENTDLYRLYGELITSNLYKLSNNHISEITLENYYNNNSYITIPLDITISPSANAKNYFKKYHKLKNAKEIVEVQKKEIEEEIHYLESIIYEFELATNISEIDSVYNEFSENFLNKNDSPSRKIKDKKKSSKKDNKTIFKIGEPIKSNIDGFNILIGKNNKQNDYITKQANLDDIWFHAKDIHGSHVILKTQGKVPSQDTINSVASIAAFYSKGSASSNVPVDYTYIKYVKKSQKSKPGMVFYTNYKNVIVKPQNISKM